MPVVREITVGHGTSVEVNGNWYKFEFGMRVELQDGDSVERAKSIAWEQCLDEVKKQIDDIMGPYHKSLDDTSDDRQRRDRDDDRPRRRDDREERPRERRGAF